RGIDGDDQHLSAQVGGGHRRGRGGGGGLAHPARSAEDHDLLGGQQRLERRLGGGVGPLGHDDQYHSPAPGASAIWRVARTPCVRWNSSGTYSSSTPAGRPPRSSARCSARVRRMRTASSAPSKSGSIGPSTALASAAAAGPARSAWNTSSSPRVN